MAFDARTREKLTTLASLWTAFASAFLVVVVANF
jgi:hypothetical protein